MPMGVTECKRGRPAGALWIGEAAESIIALGLQHGGIGLEQHRNVVAAGPSRRVDEPVLFAGG